MKSCFFFKRALLIGAALFLSQSFVEAASILNVTIIDPNRLGPPGVLEDFQGTITNNTQSTLDSTDLFFNFAAYDPLKVSLSQILGSTSFSIAPGATSSVVDLFTFSLASSAAAPAVYSADVVLEDVNGNLTPTQTVSITTGAPEPAYLGLFGVGLLLLGLARGRNRKLSVFRVAVLPVMALAIVSTKLEAQVSAVEFVTGTPGITLTGSGKPLLVALPIKNNGTLDATNVQVTSATLRSASLVSPASFPVALGVIGASHSAVFQASFNSGSLAVGTPYLLTVRGSYEVGGQTAGFAVNRFIEVTSPNGGAIAPKPLPPPPPARVGCYVNTRNGWKTTPCATDAFIDAHFPHPDVQLAVTTPSSTPIVTGQVQVTIPEVSSVNNVFLANSFGGCPTSGSNTMNQWSVQNNVNGWTIGSGTNKGDTATTQFVTQSDGTNTGICVWNIDVTKQDYSAKTCYSTATVAQRAGGLQAFDSANISGTVNGDGTMTMIADISWVNSGQPNQYAVVANDTYGLAGNWSNVGGGLLGIGNCSQAQLANAEIVTQVLASTCAGDTQAQDAVCAPPTLQPNATTFEGAIGTVETNNLAAIGTPSLTYLNSDLVISNLTGTTTGTCLGPSKAYVKDSPSDFGGTPSTIGNQVFWESPDIFVVPTGTPVDLTSVSTESAITPGGVFDVWVRLHNDLGCSDVTGAKTLVYLADPAALSVQWDSITGGSYVGDNFSSTGVTVPAGGQALIGPLTFTAPTTGIGNGHKCLLAAVQAIGEAPPANSTDAPNSNQVAQRNLQFLSPCAYPLTNGTASDVNVQITLSVTPTTGAPPTLASSPLVSVDFSDADSSWFNVWKNQSGNGSTFSVTHSSNTTTVTLGTFSVTMDQVPMPAGQTRNAIGLILPESGSLTLQIGATLTDSGGNVLVTNGGSCTASAIVIR